jgi:hypothetical protein
MFVVVAAYLERPPGLHQIRGVSLGLMTRTAELDDPPSPMPCVTRCGVDYRPVVRQRVITILPRVRIVSR